MGDTKNGTWTSKDLGDYIRKQRLYRWEETRHLADIRELDNPSRLQRSLAAYFLFFYKEKCANGVTEECYYCGEPASYTEQGEERCPTDRGDEVRNVQRFVCVHHKKGG
jgi:hypothetical protein